MLAWHTPTAGVVVPVEAAVAMGMAVAIAAASKNL